MVTICSFCGKDISILENDIKYKDTRFVVCKGCGVGIPKGANSYHRKYCKEGEMAEEKKTSRRGLVIEALKSGFCSPDEVVANVQAKAPEEQAGKIKSTIRQIMVLVKTSVLKNYKLEEKDGKLKLIAI